jgi:hypothetical protein
VGDVDASVARALCGGEMIRNLSRGSAPQHRNPKVSLARKLSRQLTANNIFGLIGINSSDANAAPRIPPRRPPAAMYAPQSGHVLETIPLVNRTTTTILTLSDIPSELILQIASLLKTEDLLALRKVCFKLDKPPP